ncbi:alanine racemase [Chloroflexota bacterium]
MAKQNIPYSTLDTPAVLIDLNKLEKNIKEMAQVVTAAKIKLRPHVKIHQCPEIAKMQLKAGACGVEVGLVDQAEVMAEARINDIVIAHPLYGERKFEKIKKLIIKPGLKLSIVIDMLEQAEALSQIGQAVNRKIPVLIKIDTGVNRHGVLPGVPVLNFAKQLHQIPNIDFIGIYAHESGVVPTDEGVARMSLEVGSIMSENARMLRRENFDIEHVSVGASSTFLATCHYIKEGILQDITEIHPGQRVIGDITYVKGHGNTREQCVLTILTTVVSTSHPTHAVIDAGFKTFGSESMIIRRETPGFFWNGMASFGSVQSRNDLWLGRLCAENGVLYYKENAKKLSLGERLEIVPNSASLVLNIHDKAYGVRNGAIEREFTITGRGRGS